MAWIAAVAAAKKRREEDEQEMALIELLRQDHPGHRYEYKVLRSGRGAFSRAAQRSRYLMEESQAGWEMVEKLDENRLVLRRERTMRESDIFLPSGVDPYRSEVDSNRPLVIGLVMAMILGISVFIITLFASLSNGQNGQIVPVLLIMLGIVLLMAITTLVIVGKRVDL